MTPSISHHSRRGFIGLGAAFGLQTALAGAQTSPALTPVRVASAPDEDILGTVWAIQHGIFQKNGLDVDLKPSNSGSAVAAALVGGSIDIGKSSLFSLINAHIRGVPFQLIATAGVYSSANAETTDIIVKSDSPIKTAKDFNGKTFSVQALDDQFAVATRAWIDQRGGDSSTVKFLEFPSAGASQAINDGRVDAASMTNPNLSMALATGKVKTVGHPFDGIGKFFIQAAYFCTNDYLAKNRETVDKFVRSINESSAYIDAHHTQTAEALSNFTKIPLEVVLKMARTQLNGKINARDVQPVIDAAFKYKAIPKTFDANDIIAKL